MNTVLVQYTTHTERVAENEALIHAVFDELRDSAPPGLHYGAFKLADGSTFIHLAVIDTPDGSNPLLSLGSFSRFQQGLPERCAAPPVASNLVPVDSYGLSLPDRPG